MNGFSAEDHKPPQLSPDRNQGANQVARDAGWEASDTAGLATCATPNGGRSSLGSCCPFLGAGFSSLRRLPLNGFSKHAVRDRAGG